MLYNINNYLAQIKHFKIVNNHSGEFSSFSHIDQAEKNSLIWVSMSKPIEFRQNILNTTLASIAIININDPLHNKISNQNIMLIRVDSPRNVFAQLMRLVMSPPRQEGIHPTAIIAASAQIDPTAYIGPYCVIGEHGVVGPKSTLISHIVLKDYCKLGSHVKIDSNTVIGSEGFGYIQEEEKQTWEHFPHIGGVRIGNNVDIGSSVTIDRGTLNDTIIGNGVKIDNQVHIAHNVIIDDHCTIIAQSMIGGSVHIGTHTWISPSVTIRDGLNIGENVMIGIGSVVTKSIPNNEVWLGNPAREKTQYYSRFNLKSLVPPPDL